MAIVNPSTPPSDAERSLQSTQYSLPLYDPHGLGSPSTSEKNNPDIWQPPQDGSPLPIETRQGFNSSLIGQPLHLDRRGRRRRSSEFVAHTNKNSESGDDSSNEGVGTSEKKVAVEPLLWWQRSKQGEEGSQEEKSGEKVKAGQPPLAPLETKRNPQPSSSPTPSILSPAAAFLSNMNESLGSPSSPSNSILGSERGYSVSPIRSGSQNYRLSMPMFSSFHESEGSALGLGSVAAQIFDTAQTSESRSASISVRPDDEGATIGPDGRYLLGKTIGFGGFSTIREAWDLGSKVERRGSVDREDLRRIAVKIVYSDDEDKIDDAAREDEELRIWETIPSHPNLLPLLHHERIVVGHGSSGGSDKNRGISFLVMPYCEGSLLAFVKSEGSLPDNVNASPSIPSLSRSGSLKAKKAPFQQYEASIRQHSAYPRTGSGFVPRSAGVRVASVPLSNVLGHLGQSPSTSASSNTTAASSSSLLRRGSSRISRATRQTNGVPFAAARKVMQQVTDALICLHTKANIVHGDLKLENVLGQRSVSRSLRSRWKGKYKGDDADSDEEDSPPMQDDVDVSSSESICWRVADFGLARRVLSNDSARKSESHHHIADMQERASRARKGKITVGGAGGSLAYTSPETFLPNTHSSSAKEEEEVDELSPFASDMWALGCILYALCSGKLPFSDSFEPRLQMKIAKGTWDMPSRLRRQNERKSTSSSTPLASVKNGRERSSSGQVASESMSRTNSLSSSFAAYKPPHLVHANAGPSVVMDMSASMPALQERHFFENGGLRSGSVQSMIDHGTGEVSYAMEEQEESSMESDDDDQIDRDIDGTSRDRVSIRLVLKKLLEPDPRKRWTIEQLAKHNWINEAFSTTFSGIEEDNSRRLSNADDYPNFQGSLMGHSMNKRPSLAHPSISERTLQETTSTYGVEGAKDVDTIKVKDEDDYGRGRTTRRDAAKSNISAAKPIDIDRSTSRSHSRPRATRTDSSPWRMEMQSSFEKALQMAGPWEQMPIRKPLQRSTSADTHGAIRGRSTASNKDRRSVSRPPGLEAVKARDRAEHSPAPPTSTSTRGSDGSASRSSTSRSRSRARDTLFDIASRAEAKESSDDRLWWQRGRKSAR